MRILNILCVFICVFIHIYYIVSMFFAYYFAYLGYFAYFNAYSAYSLRILLRIYLRICLFCIFCVFCVFAYFLHYFILDCNVALQSVLIRWHILHIALHIFQSGWGKKYYQNALMCTGVEETRTKDHMVTIPALCQPSHWATTVKSPWSDEGEKSYLLNCCTIASFPMKGPSCWHTTTCTSPLCPLICYRQRQESQQILFSSQTVLSLFNPLGQEEGVPV